MNETQHGIFEAHNHNLKQSSKNKYTENSRSEIGQSFLKQFKGKKAIDPTEGFQSHMGRRQLNIFFF